MTTGDIVSLADAKTFLNITSSSNDAELGAMISSASALWVRRVGPVAGSPSYDEYYDGGQTTVSVRHFPVLTVTAVVEAYSSSFVRTLAHNEPDAGSPSAYDYSVDLVAGTFTRRAMGIAVPFAWGDRNIHITYTAGYSSTPADITHAVLLLVSHMWDTQRGRMILPGNADQGWNPALSFTWPQRVQEIAAGYIVPGIA